MNIYATSFCKGHRLDPWIEDLLLTRLGNLRYLTLPEAKVILVTFTWMPDYVFDASEFEKVTAHGAPFIVLDYLEHGPDVAFTLLGAIFDDKIGVEYKKLHEALKATGRIVKYFKRELPTGPIPPVPFPVKPLDFVVKNYTHENVVQTEAEFMARPIDILMIWGSSSGDRPLLAGELIKQLDQFGSYPHFALQLRDLEYNIREHKHCPIALLYQNAYWNRLPMDQVMGLQRQAKISISCRGTGIKCFRSAEAGYNSILAQQGLDQVKWAFPWHPPGPGLPTFASPAPNCINLPCKANGHIDEIRAVAELHRWTRVERGWLYPMYKLGVIHNRSYVVHSYCASYLLPEICSSL